MRTATPTRNLESAREALPRTAAPAWLARPARPAGLAGVTLVLAALALAPALVANAAATPGAPAIADRVGQLDGAGYVGFTAQGGDTYWATSTDGHWFTWVTDGTVPPETPFGSARPFNGLAGAPLETCPWGAGCFRTVPGTIGVVSTRDYVTWTPEFSLSGPQLAAIAAGAGSPGAGVGSTDANAANPAPTMESLDITGVARGDLFYVYVANGSDGFAVRASTGIWGRASTHPVLRNDGTIEAATEIAPPPVPLGWSAARLAPLVWAGIAWAVAALALAITLRRRTLHRPTPGQRTQGRAASTALALGAAGVVALGVAWVATLGRATPSWDPASLAFDAARDGRTIVGLVAAALVLTAGAVVVALPPRSRVGANATE